MPFKAMMKNFVLLLFCVMVFLSVRCNCSTDNVVRNRGSRYCRTTSLSSLQPSVLQQLSSNNKHNHNKISNNNNNNNRNISILPSTSPRGGASAAIYIRRALFRRQKKITGGDASFISSIFNLINNVAGAGLLALSAGQAMGTGWIPAITIAILLGIISARTFIMIGQACELTDEDDFKGLWSRTMGDNTTWIVDTMIAILCLACSVIYSGILGDVFTPLIEQFKLLPISYNHRTTNIIALTTFILLPMSLLKNLSALAFTSILGFGSILYTVLFISIRAFDGSYKLNSGKYVIDDKIIIPKFDNVSLYNIDYTSLVLASNYGLAFVAHYNAPTFFHELQNTNGKCFTIMVSIAFIILIILYIITMSFGYIAFGDICKGNILLNYHPDDILATLAGVATGLSILFGYPLVIAGAHEGLINAASGLGYTQLGSNKNHAILVITMLAFVTFIACTVDDVSSVVGLTGAVLGSAIVYICPALIYTTAFKLVKGANSIEYKKAKWNLSLVPFGIAIAAFGVYMNKKEYL